jgi:hypothetical protein
VKGITQFRIFRIQSRERDTFQNFSAYVSRCVPSDVLCSAPRLRSEP